MYNPVEPAVARKLLGRHDKLGPTRKECYYQPPNADVLKP